jgi:hypothetical protein
VIKTDAERAKWHTTEKHGLGHGKTTAPAELLEIVRPPTIDSTNGELATHRVTTTRECLEFITTEYLLRHRLIGIRDTVADLSGIALPPAVRLTCRGQDAAPACHRRKRLNLGSQRNLGWDIPLCRLPRLTIPKLAIVIIAPAVRLVVHSDGTEM